MEDKLIDILQNFKNDKNYNELNAVDDILRLFNVSGTCSGCDWVDIDYKVRKCIKCNKTEQFD